jgi:hypothetical protein
VVKWDGLVDELVWKSLRPASVMLIEVDVVVIEVCLVVD